MRKYVLGLLLLGLLSLAAPLQAQGTVVYGIFFYSPTCPHCHEVLDNHWGNIQSEFGDQLKVLFVDITTEEGSQRMRRTVAEMGIPSNGVPMLIIGRDVLLGSVDIPTRTPPLVRAWLANGGLGYPPVTGVDDWFEQEFGSSEQTRVDLANLTFASDKIANSLAVLVLVALVISLLALAVAMINPALRDTILGTLDSLVVIGGAVFGMILAFSILIGNTPAMPVQLLAASVATALGAIVVSLFVQPIDAPKATWLIPLLLTVGLAIAGYLTYIKFTTSAVSCGAIGNCGAVQHSEYAQVLGVPVGVLGLVGYSLLLLTWFISQYAANAVLWGKILFGITLCGVVFSAYLTFLEPFVIGATCVWCLLSAVVMLMLLWLTASTLWLDTAEETATVIKRRVYTTIGD